MDLFEEITYLIKGKNYLKAREAAQNIKDEVEKYNVLGIISFYEGKYELSVQMLDAAIKLSPTRSDLLFNLSKSLFEAQEYFESWRYLTRICPKTWEVYDMLGDTQVKADNPAMALYYYKKSYEISKIPQILQKYEALKTSNSSRKKIALLCLPTGDNFIRDVAYILSEIYDVRLVVTGEGEKIAQAYEWAEIVWIEWANDLAVEITNRLAKNNKRIVCRLHSYEALAEYPEKIKWSNVNKLILVSGHIERILKKYHSKSYDLLKNKIEILPNGVDLNKFIFKIREHGVNMAVVANIDNKKDPAAWMQVIGSLVKADKRYVLHIAGNFQDIRYENYFDYFVKENSLEDNLKFYGYVKDINQFLDNKNYILSTSIHEGHPYNIMEAMARGIKPLIHNYCGSKVQWPGELVYNFASEIPSMLKNEYDSHKYRKHVEDRYSLEKQVSTVVKLINNLR